MSKRFLSYNNLIILVSILFLTSCSALKKAVQDEPIQEKEYEYSWDDDAVKSKKKNKKSKKKKSKNKTEETATTKTILGFKLDKNNNAKLYSAIEKWIGVKYKMGGCDMTGTDCSGFTLNIYEEVYKKKLPRTSRDMYDQCTPVKKEDLQEGDLVFFKIGGNRITHVGIYLKDSKFAHASSSKGVIVSSLEEAYYKKYFFSGGRVK